MNPSTRLCAHQEKRRFPFDGHPIREFF